MLHRSIAALALGFAFVFGPAAPALAQAAPAAAPAPARIWLDAPDGRRIDVSVWEAVNEQGVVVFSHGFNSDPERYARIIPEWVEQGFTVVAPLHIDSLRHPDHEGATNEQAFATRIMDLAVTRGFVKVTRAGTPIIAAGHSFGSLMSLISGGAATVAGAQHDPDVKAVVALSSAGDIPGVVDPQTWAGMKVPVLMITGDADLVPGWVTDWTAHRAPFARSPAGDKMLLVFEGGDHSLVRNADEADFDLIARTTVTFMEAYGLGDPEARQALETLTAPAGVTIERR